MTDTALLEGTFCGFDAAAGDGDVWTVTLRRPGRMNAMGLTTKRELAEWLVHAQVDEQVRVVVFTGADDVFCSGDDVAGQGDVDLPEPRFVRPLQLGQRVPMRVNGALRMGSQPLVRALRAFDKPTVAAVNGYAIQSGLTLALGCDFRIAAQRAKLGSGTLRFAFTPDDGGHHLLVQHLGLARAIDFVMRNRIVSASSALELGLVHEVVPDEQLDAVTRDLALELARGPQVAMRLVKRSLLAAAELSFEQSMEDIAVRTAISDYHPDAEEGLAAFREKRPPAFNQWLDRES